MIHGLISQIVTSHCTQMEVTGSMRELLGTPRTVQKAKLGACDCPFTPQNQTQILQGLGSPHHLLYVHH